MSIAVRMPEHVFLSRQRFIGNLRSVMGTGARVLYMPSYGEGTTVPDAAVPTRVWTHGNTPVGRLTRLGKGAALSFNGTSDYLTTVDAADLSFGNSAADNAGGFSMFAVLNVTDTAAPRRIIAKNNTANNEWQFAVSPTDFLNMTVTDNSVPTTPTRVADAIVTSAVWRTYGCTYTAATGGATAANDITLYTNGAVIASTATNQATYVAMEDLASAVEIGSDIAHTSNFFAGSGALWMVWTGGSTAQHFQLDQLARRFFGI